MKIQTILILVELDNGHVHQVLASREQKEVCVALLRSEAGVLRLSERVEPVTLELHPTSANADTSSPRAPQDHAKQEPGGDCVSHLVRPSWLTDDVGDMIERAKLKGWTVWHWPAGDSSPGETALISGSYDADGIRARWKNIREGCGGETEPFLGLDRLRQIAAETSIELIRREGRANYLEENSKQETGEGYSGATCSAGWFLTGWQRKWTRTTGNDWYVARVFSRTLGAEDRYQRVNQMGKYSLPSVERGCYGKADLGRFYVKQADKLASKHGKKYGVYRCPHCGGTHLTTKFEKSKSYAPLIHISEPHDRTLATQPAPQDFDSK